VRTTGKRATLIGVMALIIAPATRAEVAIPVIGQPSPFYGAAGKAIKVEARADPVELSVDDSLVYTLTIRNLLNPADVQRPDLGEIEAFRRSFQIDDVTDPVTEPAGTRVFRYRLRPRRADITAIPKLTFPYYNPNLPQPADMPGFPFQRVQTDEIPIRIRKAAPPAVAAGPVDVPPFAESLAGHSTAAVPGWAWWLAAVAPPVIALVGCAVWRGLNPEGTRLARRRRSRAARTALKNLHSLGRHPPVDLAAVVWAVAGYLAERYDLPGVFRTPGEVADRMREAGANKAEVIACADFFHEADAARFSPTPEVTAEVVLADAERLIRCQEGDG
jgi:hypothetical protein